MLDQARRRGVYTALHEADLTRHLQRTALRPELVLAADVFIYVGAVEPIFEGVRRVLPDGGVFVFTVETVGPAELAGSADSANSANSAGFVLRRSGRYAHTQAYVTALAASHGFDTVAAVPLVLREEQGQPIAGRVLTLRARLPAT